jgi:hypothetical protein
MTCNLREKPRTPLETTASICIYYYFSYLHFPDHHSLAATKTGGISQMKHKRRLTRRPNQSGPTAFTTKKPPHISAQRFDF